MVCVEAWTKHVEMIPLRDKSAEEVANAFLSNVLARFSAPAEVVTDNGTEFQGAFAALLEQCFIDHRHTSPNHPQANGAAERVVQVCKRALRKYCAFHNSADTWDLALPWVLLGYRCSPQASTGKSPFELMYGAPPLVPLGSQEYLLEPLDLLPRGEGGSAADAPAQDNERLARAEQLIQFRADVIQRQAPFNGSNLLIAQQRDQHRYARVRAGGYKPRFASFQPGDYVYILLRNQTNTLQLPARDAVLRIASVSDEGTAALTGRDGNIVKEHVSNLVPCHLQDIDPIIDPRIAIPPLDLACEICAYSGDGPSMLLCDHCGTGWHMRCLAPPLKRKPRGTWVCPDCHAVGITPEAVDRKPAPAPRPEVLPSPFLDAGTRRRMDAAKAYDGAPLTRKVKDPATGSFVERRGTLSFLGAAARPNVFLATYTDGTTERLSMRAAKSCARLPVGVLTTAVGAPPAPLPDAWEVLSPSSRAAALLQLGSVPQLAALMPDRVRTATSAGEPPHDAAIDLLLAHLDLSRSPVLLDPCAGTGTLAAALRARGYAVSTNEGIAYVEKVWPRLDPLQPGTYRRLARSEECWHVISAPHADLLPLWLPLAIAMVPLVAVYVSRALIVGPPPAWAAFFNQLCVQERLVVVTGAPCGFSGGKPGAWLVVFRDSALRGQQMKGIAKGRAGHWVFG
jgi:hypothetical protein